MKFFKIVLFSALATVALILEAAHIIGIVKTGFSKYHAVGLIAGFITVAIMIHQILMTIEGN